MNNFQRTLTNDVELELKIKFQLEKELQKLPEGRIKSSRKGKSLYIGKGTVYKSAAKEPTLLEQLRRRRLIEETLKRLDKNIYWQEKTLQNYKCYDEDSVLKSLPRVYRRPETEKDKEFEMKNVIKRTSEIKQTKYHEEGLSHHMITGEIRRSKSEIIISMLLDTYGVNFTYEERLYWPFAMPWEAEQCKEAAGLPNSVLPDFTIILPHGEQIYWEHLGLLNKPEYAGDWMKKMLFYHWLGIDQGRNLIVTTDDYAGHLDQIAVAEIIRTQILKR